MRVTRHWLVVSLSALCWVLSGCGSSDPSPEDPGTATAPLLTGPVSLVTQNSGKCLTATGSVATQQTCAANLATQQWVFAAVTGGFQITVASNPNLCLNVPNGTATLGTQLAVTSCTPTDGKTSEIWSAPASGTGFNLVSAVDKQCVDVNNASTADGTPIIQWTCSGQPNQVWNQVGPPPSNVTLVAKHSGKCLTASGSVATQQKCTSSAAQLWSFAAVTGGLQIKLTSNPAVCLNVPNATTTLGTQLAVTSCTPTDGKTSEIWTTPSSGTSVNLVSALDQQCVDVNTASTADGTPIIQWTCSGATNQMWTEVAGPTDAGAPAPDAGSDAAVADAGRDSAVADAGVDSAVADTGADSAVADAGVDSAVADAGSDAAIQDGAAAGGDATAADAAGGSEAGLGPAGPSGMSLVVLLSGKCIGNLGGLATEETCTGDPTQQWSYVAVAGGYQIVLTASPGLCLSVPSGATTPGVQLAVVACSPGDGQLGEIWSAPGASAGFNVVSALDQQCIDVNHASSADGTPIIQWTCNGQQNQQWALETIAPAPPVNDAGTTGPADVTAPAPDSGTPTGPAPSNVSLVVLHSGKCMTATGGLATQQTCTGIATQQWTFVPVSGGYQITSVSTPSLCLNVPNGTTVLATQLAVSACSPADGNVNEIWAVQTSQADFNIVSALDQQCIDVNNGSTADGAAVIQWTCNGQQNQMWTAQSIAAPSPPADAGADATVADTGSAPIPDAGAIAPNVSLVAANSGDCVGAAGIATQGTCNGDPSQQWTFQPVSGGYQLISGANATQCLSVPNATLGQQLGETPCVAGGAPGQVWALQAAGANYNLIATSDQLCMDVFAQSTSAGATIDQYTCNGQPNQSFAFQWFPTSIVDPTVGGQWSAAVQLPSIPVAAAVMPNGKIVTWSSWEPDDFGGAGDLPQTYTNLFDPVTLTATLNLVTQTNHDMFCPGTAMLSDGRALINGGGPVVANTTLYNAFTNTWAADALMNEPRWYAVSVTLPDGRVFTLGGNRLSGLDGTGEIWTQGAGWKTVPGAVMTPLLTADTTNRSQEHPRLFVAPNGLIFVPGPTPNMQWYNLAGSGTITSAGPRGDDVFSQNDATVMYDVGKLLKAGGNTNYDQPNAATTPSSANSYVIDINTGTAVVQKIAPLHYARAYATGVVLPNGEVLVVGGLNNGKAFSDDGALMTPEMFNPTTKTWRDLTAMSIPRTYHSIALLLPDARVVVGGGGLCGAGCAANHSDVQIYSPPYLFQGVRPQIASAPAAAIYGAAVPVTTTGTVTGFSWIRMSSVTHTINTDQRWMAAPATATGGGAYTVTAPANANLAPPGYYYLFALNGSVPSVAAVIRIGAQ